MPPLEFTTWSAALDASAALRTPDDAARFCACCDAVTGAEDPVPALEALVAAVLKEDDHGVYEALHNALWRFPPEILGATLGRLLPGWYRRMRRAPFQVERFLGVLLGVGAAARPAFIEALRALPATERAAVRRAFERWALEAPDVEGLVEPLRDKPKKPARAPALPDPPAEWPAEWKAHLAALRAGESVTGVWSSGSLEEMEIVAALLTQPVGKDYRHLDTLSYPLYGSFAKKHWRAFVAKVASFDSEAREMVIAQLTKASGRNVKRFDRGAILREALEGKGPAAEVEPEPLPTYEPG